MSCPILTKWRQSPVGTHSKSFLQLVDFTPKLEASLMTKLDGTTAKDFQSQLGEHLYYAIGSALCEKGDWNRMTFLQLEYQARVLGLLGAHQDHTYDEWQLRLMLACEAKGHEVWVGDSEATGANQGLTAAC